MKNQALFSSKDKSKKLKCRLLQFSFGPLRVKLHNIKFCIDISYKIITAAFVMVHVCNDKIQLRCINPISLRLPKTP